jgi:malate/lactate dehydrogenase
MSIVCILGAGELGGAVAQALARGDRISRVLLVDAGTVAAGKALDIQQACAIEGGRVRLDGTDDVTRVAGCHTVVVADRAGKTTSEWQGDEGLDLLMRVGPFCESAPIVFSGAQQAGLILTASREAGIRRERLIGSAPDAFASAVRAIVALEAGCSPSDVNLAVLGVPAGLVVPWSEASIGGYAVDRVLSAVQLARVEARAARLWPPGPYALGLAAARVVEAILGSSRRAFNVLTVLGGEFGVRDRVGTLPAHMAAAGIVHTRTPTLNTRERVQLETALGS